mgnify:CR=1 FL=1
MPCSLKEICVVALRSNVPVDHLELVLNGQVIRQVPLDRDRRSERPDYRHRCYAEPTPAPGGWRRTCCARMANAKSE